MASTALQRLDQIQAASAKEQYGKVSEQFVSELKGATLFQHDWGGLLGAAPTALSLMGACWLAASNPTAEKISLAKSKPVDGFKYMTNSINPTLRACLVDVCNNGGREAFTKAGENMDGLRQTSRRIVDERIPKVFRLLVPCTLGQDQYEDFKDALTDFSNDAKTCAKLAAVMREAFGTWGKMVGELHAVAENQEGLTAIDEERTRVDEAVAEIEKSHTSEALDEVKKQVTRAAKNVDKQQQNLDKMIDNVPGPWATVLQTAVTSFAQALPSIVGGVVAAKTGGATALAGAAANAVGTAAGGQNGAASSSTGTTTTKSPTPAPTDPSYATAAIVQNLVNHFYTFLGGEKGKIQWDKFKDTPTKSKDSTDTDDKKDDDDVPQGLAYILGTLKGQKANIDVTNTAPNKKLLGAYDSLIKLATELQTHLRKQNDLNSSLDPAESVSKEWRATCLKARDDIIELAAVAKTSGSTSVPQAFGNVQIPPPDLSAQTAQLNTAMQGVQIAQQALDNAEKAYDAAIDKQEKVAKAMATIQAKLTKLAKTGQTLEEIKQVLRDCIAVLADLIVQITRLERFFIALTTVIDVLVMPRADDFEKALDKTAKRALRSGVLRVDDINKQGIYTSTLQLKAYFSLLQDIADMYCDVHRDHIVGGVELCYEMSKNTARNDGMPDLQAKLATYTDNASKKVAAIVSAKQQEMLRTLRERARRAEAQTKQIEEEMRQRGVQALDASARRAIESGAQSQQQQAAVLLQQKVSETRVTTARIVSNPDNFDLNEL
ncbi:hypothetical protein B0J18DRAFT_469994 [Chaetomium sp. MPI-SDFR-AT-0129]|nr:hypothetical protein B0J18DRAFT_469994 [Chaetomium sp. MPI-SDFR-AT-0129]